MSRCELWVSRLDTCFSSSVGEGLRVALAGSWEIVGAFQRTRGKNTFQAAESVVPLAAMMPSSSRRNSSILLLVKS